jgi:hypothetical protein
LANGDGTHVQEERNLLHEYDLTAPMFVKRLHKGETRGVGVFSKYFFRLSSSVEESTLHAASIDGAIHVDVKGRCLVESLYYVY